ncbi:MULTISPECIES: MetQ/NlpA family ABC transporter substrate-binding protein [Comamonas]|jgi:D-methionine transport system substrate-binding protein|uniref:D-methionine-binding lipoprotein metQ n=4 Tax=Comamonas TaxID=283 RepID=A0A1Y1J2I8_COMTE|nr:MULTISPECIES: MetQ/NlpA family ABC transporter substrate-binding protein [Comamonas]ACY32698.1 MetQ protein [Comamonas thiooxydans]AIJ46491.1 methionine ABC transporter substrate-binding protein [Comamonas testosteroni TK102]EED67887.1 lipoprotein, YaeC family [Comamonas testosteroni KF-1]EFI62678.1 MetQ protein [Comamonas thiooxydans]EHN64051.1 MetQ protein [Comamonas testosteroni ATCC 11996]
MLKKALSAIAIATLALSAQAADVLKVGATAVPHAEILNHIKPALKAQGIDLEIKEFSDYVQPNAAVEDKQLDANFFQHQPYLDSYNKDRKTSLVAVPNGKVHVEPFGAYSSKIKNIKDLKNGATVAIPNDPSNGGRALILLAKHGLIELKDPKSLTPTALDVVKNPKKLKFKELEAPLLPRALADVDLALINTNYAIEAKLNPTKDALFIEGADSPYTNIVVARKDRANGADIAKLMSALHSADTKKFIQEKYKGAVVPAF